VTNSSETCHFDYFKLMISTIWHFNIIGVETYWSIYFKCGNDDSLYVDLGIKNNE
jgi:hypothetical protein